MSDRRFRAKHNAISNALEVELIDCGITADNELEKIFERILVPNMPRQEFELRVADLRNELEQTLARYVLLNVKSAANAVLDALEEVSECLADGADPTPSVCAFNVDEERQFGENQQKETNK
jgi:hypothetical protein